MKTKVTYNVEWGRKRKLNKTWIRKKDCSVFSSPGSVCVRNDKIDSLKYRESERKKENGNTKILYKWSKINIRWIMIKFHWLWKELQVFWKKRLHKSEQEKR